ncbi:hypothetical protein IL306_014119 [Fusarium sp. DS 682]|nr:hypothetical protein IL306_014119 [Fusarium sp. DS 682]
MEAENNVSRNNIKIPIEIILLVIESLVPQNGKTRPILPASHPTTQLLLSLTRVSKATYPTACKLLWQNCLYLDTKPKLRKFRRFLTQKSPITGQLPCEAYGPARLYLSPLHDRFDTASAYETFSPQRRSSGDFRRVNTGSDSDMPSDYSDEWSDGSQMVRYRAPPQSSRSESPVDDGYSQYSTHDWRDAPMQDLRTVHILKDVLLTLAPVLKTLIVDMPLRDLDPSEDKRILEPLRQGFEALVNVEELISVKDELYLGTQPDVWTNWPKLRRLCLYNPVIDEELWRDMASSPKLETAVFIRPDPFHPSLSEEDIKVHWERLWAAANSQGVSYQELLCQGPEITIVFCNWPAVVLDLIRMEPRWKKVDPDNKFSVLNVVTHAADDKRARRRRPIASFQDWVRDQALGDKLWREVNTKCQRPYAPTMDEASRVKRDNDEWVDEED